MADNATLAGATVSAYAFDPWRTTILLIGGDNNGDDRWYETYVAPVDRLYDEHLAQLRREGERTNGEEH